MPVLTAKQVDDFFVTGRNIRTPDSEDEIFLSWTKGKKGAWVTIGGINGKKRIIMKNPLVKANFDD